MQKSLFGKYLRITMVIVFASFVVLGSVMMISFSEYTKNDKRKILTQSANSMASLTTATLSINAEDDVQNASRWAFLRLFVQTF